MTNDVTLFLGLATATATALGAAVALGLLTLDERRDRSRWRAPLAAAVLAVAVLGIGAALIAVGKGQSTRLLTWLMFLGLAAPSVFALHRAFARIIARDRYANAVWLASIASVGILLAITSPSVYRNLFDPDEADAVVRFAVSDRSDPNQSGCSPTGREIPGTRVDIVDGDRHYGVMYLKYSTACGTVWARVDGLPERLAGPMHFNLISGNLRAEKAVESVTFHYDFTDQLRLRTSCIQGEFYYGTTARRALTRTRCASIDDPDQLAADPAVPPAPGAPADRTVPEQQGALGTGTYSHPHRRRQDGPRMAPFQRVDVTCKVWTTRVRTAWPDDGYLYRIATPPWSNRFYAPALSFWNGDKPGAQVAHNTDWDVPNC